MEAPTLLDEMIAAVRNDEDLALAVSTTLPRDTNVAHANNQAIRLHQPQRRGDWVTGTMMHTLRGRWEPMVAEDSVLIHVAQIVTVTTHRHGERLDLTLHDNDD